MKSGGYKVDVNRRERSVRVSSEWFNRPEDERSLSLDELWASVIVLWLASVFFWRLESNHSDCDPIPDIRATLRECRLSARYD